VAGSFLGGSKPPAVFSILENYLSAVLDNVAVSSQGLFVDIFKGY
jgi:hypothetical protein